MTNYDVSFSDEEEQRQNLSSIANVAVSPREANGGDANLSDRMRLLQNSATKS